MPLQQTDGLDYFTFECLPAGEMTHAVFTRRGGVSPAPWHALNVGGTVGDERERVRENRFRAFRALGRDPRSLYDVWQIHSADVVLANAPGEGSPPELRADAIITDNPVVTLFMRFADCVPILLYDPAHRAVGIVHAGWQGTVKQVAAAAVRAMTAAFDSRPGDLLAGIGPSIGPDHYEVGPDVIARVHQSFGDDAEELLPAYGDRRHFDLWAANRLSLEQAGVRQIEVAGLCTACHTHHWYSHRAEKGRTGRFGALIALNAGS
jgi:purine-nucleoside/S-methyl-5'-thioadenosine phosphorylase / adenosine deaminase